MGGISGDHEGYFIVKPLVTTADGSKRIYWGDTVVATPGGARRMGKRPREIVEVR